MKIKSFLSLVLFLFFNSNQCVIYKAKPLDTLELVTEKPQTISFNYRIFNQSDCKKFLGRSMLIKNGYQPIQISFTNNSDSHFTLSLADFNLPCIAYDEVAESVYFSAVKRGIVWGIGALFIWPLVIPAIVEVTQCPEANDRIDRDYFNKSLTTQIVKPFTTVNNLIFVSVENFDSKFSFVVADLENDAKYVLSTSEQINYLSDSSTVESDKA